jgi:hypothetical protein
VEVALLCDSLAPASRTGHVTADRPLAKPRAPSRENLDTLRTLSNGAPVVDAINDAYWLDHPSASVLGEEHHAPAGANPDDRRILRIRVDPNEPHALGEVELPAGATADSHLLAHVPVRQRDRRYEVAVRQMYQGREVGRLTRQLVPTPWPGSRS